MEFFFLFSGLIILSYILFISSNLLILLLWIEGIWVSFFIYLIIQSVSFNVLFFFIFALFILVLGAIETSIGLGILNFYMHIFNKATFSNFAKTPGLIRKHKKKLINGKIK